MSLGIYIQVPFCQTKCTYCNFHTGVVSRDRYQPYAEAVCRDIATSAVSPAVGSASSNANSGANSDAKLGCAASGATGTAASSLASPAVSSAASFSASSAVGSAVTSAASSAVSSAVDSASCLGGRSFSSDMKPPRPSGVSTPEANDPVSSVVDTVYFGGGTPSLLDPAALETILNTLRATHATQLAEVTLEADPETITPERASAWLAAGFNRVSLGSQSFDDRELQAAGRMHRRADIFRAAELLRAAGFRNISMDLIAGLPHQTRESWEESVARLLRIRPEHISIYMLEIDEGSRLGRESLAGGNRYSAAAIPDDDAMAEFYESAGAHLASAGYDHYEISNWALPGRRSRHNLKYWRREPYLGFGAGAHSFDGATRWANVHDSARYVV
jgi:coproporphyrinogen III oxidase-like Fe-S oxidoreductase